ncbi:MAG: N-acetyl-gamma-glutamyl-phosphate reductase, partial [Deltaproteobacteria bacterium]
MVKVAIVGASGYTGLELIRILLGHPEVTITCLTSEQSSGKTISQVFPALLGRCDLMLENLVPEMIADKAEVIFSAL